MKLITTLLSIALLTGAFSWSNDPFLTKVNQQIKAYSLAQSHEKIYVHTDKPFYFPGENLWFSGYLRSSVVGSSVSKLAYVQLLDTKGKVVQFFTLPVHDGKFSGDLAIPANAPGGIYSIRAYTTRMWNAKPKIIFEKKIQVQQVAKPRLLLNLDFAREAYGAQDTVVAKLAAKSLKNVAIASPDISYKVMLNGKPYKNALVRTNAEGKANIQFVLPKKLTSNDGILNVIVKHQGVSESISRAVPIVLGKVTLDFFPEGGNWVTGIQQRMAFKALNEFGQPADIAGEVIDGNGKVVRRFESFHQGMGAFELSPVANQRYQIRLTKPQGNRQTYALPSSQTGFALGLSSTKHKVKLRYYSPTSEPVYLVAQSGSKVVFSKKLSPKQGWNQRQIALSKFPIGIARITLFDAKQHPRCTRLLFANAQQTLRIKIKTNKPSYRPREQVNAQIYTTNHLGQPVAANLSVAVVNDQLLSLADDKQDNLLSYMLMSAELSGKVHEPNFYFKKNEPKAKAALDYVMLTHGWQHYAWDKVMNKKHDPRYRYDQQEVLSGRVIDRASKKPVKGEVYLFELSSKHRATKVETLDDGRFSFLNIDPRVPIQLVAQSIETTPKPCLIKLNTKSAKEGNINSPQKLILNTKLEEVSLTEVVVTAQGVEKTRGQSLNGGLRIPKIKLFKRRRKRRSRKRPSQSNKVAQVVKKVSTSTDNDFSDASIKLEPVFDDFQGRPYSQEISRVPTLTPQIKPHNLRDHRGKVKRYSALPIVVPKGVQYVIDGIPVQDPHVLSHLAPQNIKSVVEEISFNGLGKVLITTKNNFTLTTTSLKQMDNLSKYEIKSKYAMVYVSPLHTSFMRVYRPKIYTIEEQSPEVRTDYRNTIYWNPSLQTDQDGRANFSFSNNDALTTFNIIAEGVGKNGQLGHHQHHYHTSLPLGLQTKLPTYFTVGDTVQLPVYISNHTSEKMKATLNISLPKGLETLSDTTKNISLKANTTRTVYMPLRAKRTLLTGEINEIVLGVKTDQYAEQMARPINILDKGFPRNVVFAGTERDNQFEVNIPDILKGSLKASLIAYPNVGSDLMTGIRSIIHQPYGCFEQVSATTYPNILALQFLEKNGYKDETFKRMAMRYIKSGYKKLAAYETSQGGFEWFGKTPPHEGLTAFGLLEFMAMQKVYEGVDTAMIARTKKWLLSRRKKNGSFRQNQGKYGFSTCPVNVANTYIVYALSEVGETQSIAKAYAKAYTEALQSKDAYRLALLALTAQNLDKPQDTNALLALLRQQVGKGKLDQLKVETSLVRSGGRSLKIEVTALAALAEMRQPNPDMSRIIPLVNYILSKRSRGYFGSTQGTILALQTLIKFAEFQEKSNTQASTYGNLLVYKGSQLIKTVAYNTRNWKSVKIEGLEKYLKQGTQNIRFKFSPNSPIIPFELNVAYQARTPLSASLCKVNLSTQIAQNKTKVNETLRLTTTINNPQTTGLPFTVALVGIPSGLSPQPWQLKQLQAQGKVAYYEVYEGYVVFYFRELAPQSRKTIHLDLKAEVAGQYQAPASCAYLYYTSEHKNWQPGVKVSIRGE